MIECILNSNDHKQVTNCWLKTLKNVKVVGWHPGYICALNLSNKWSRRPVHAKWSKRPYLSHLSHHLPVFLPPISYKQQLDQTTQAMSPSLLQGERPGMEEGSGRKGSELLRHILMTLSQLMSVYNSMALWHSHLTMLRWSQLTWKFRH